MQHVLSKTLPFTRLDLVMFKTCHYRFGNDLVLDFFGYFIKKITFTFHMKSSSQ